MNKSLMIPIRPEHAYNIIVGKKTLDLRSWIPKDYVGWVYVYVTKAYPLLNYIDGKYELMDRKKHRIFHNIGMYEFYNHDIHLNGKVVFRFWFDEYEDIDYQQTLLNKYSYETLDYQINIQFLDNVEYILNDNILDKLCLTYDEVKNYGKGKDLYAWHINKLEVFDKPKKLSDFYVTNKGLTYKYIKEYEERTHDYVSFRLKKAPRKMVWVYTKENEK